MDALEETAADFATTGLTTARHPMSYLRDQLRSTGVFSAADLGSAKDGSWVTVAGVVIVRQRPGTAQGFLFVTLEDETGLANAIVTPDVFQHQRVLLRRARILKVGGPLQKVRQRNSCSGSEVRRAQIAEPSAGEQRFQVIRRLLARGPRFQSRCKEINDLKSESVLPTRGSLVRR
jgi:DNA polymerase III alpha subunit